ncbi:apolipoprotein B receptor [Anomaloglossus baeobatrachus]|uniref:apolipoprotein B receptor n=1 Tax=Anomaloglossus baeobatrachus TaxID=238106 RepID=UPI003F507A3C
MEFLQRHLPRVYQAVQNALEYITSVTAQIFGAPPDAPQPRNARAKTPLQSQDAAAKSQGPDQTTLVPDVTSEEAALEATEESMKMYGIQQDVESQAQETTVRHRKENVDRRNLDHHHTISDATDTFSHQDESRGKTTTTDDQKPPNSEGMEHIPCRVVTEIHHAEIHPVINEEALVYEEHTRIKSEKKSISRLEYLLRDLEPKSYQDHEDLPTRDQVPKSSVDFKMKENPSSNENVSPSLGKTITNPEISEEAMTCHLTLTSEDVDQEPPEDVSAIPLIMEYDDLDVPDIKRQHKKLVTPVSAEDKSPSDQGEEAKKTWEHLQETAVRLAIHCDLFQGIDHEFETIESEDTQRSSHEDKINLSGLNKRGDSEEHRENTSHDQKDLKELSSEEKERPEKISSVSEVGEKRESGEQGQRVEKMRRRVHFSPSVDERDQMSEEIVWLKAEGLHKRIIEYRDHQPNSHPRTESGETSNDKEDDIGFISSNQVFEPSFMDPNIEGDQMKPLQTGITVWYDELEMSTHTGEETNKSIGDVTYQSVTLGFQSEEIVNVFPDKKSLEELSRDVSTVEEIPDSEEKENEHSESTLQDNLTHTGVDDHGEGTQRFSKIDGPLEKIYRLLSDHSSQEGSNSEELCLSSISLDAESQSSEEIKVDLLLYEKTESINQPFHGGVDGEHTDSKEELLQILCHPSVEEESTKGGITPMTDELNLLESRLEDEPDGPREATVSGYTSVEENMQTSFQELDASKNDQKQDDIISIESERRLSIDSSNIDNVRTVEGPSEEGSEGSVGRNLLTMSEAQNEEDIVGNEYHDVQDLREIEPVLDQIEERVKVKEEHEIQEMDDYMWYKQESYQNDGLIIYSDSFEESGSQKDPTEKADESAGSEDEIGGICRNTETGFDLLSEIQSVINISQPEQDFSEVIERSETTHDASADDYFLEDTTELKFQIDNAVKDLDFEMSGHPVDKISEDLPEENQTSLTPDETLGDQSLERVKELEVLLDTEILNPSEVILDQSLFSEQSIMSMDHPDKRFEIISTINVGQSDKGVEDVGHANEKNEEHENSEEYSFGLHLSEELGSPIEPVETFEVDDYSSICITATKAMMEISDIGLDTNNTSGEISENKEVDGQIRDDQSSPTLDEASNGQFRDQILDSVQKMEMLLDTDDNNEVIIGSTSESYSNTVEGGNDHLSSMDPSAEVIVSSMNESQSDNKVEDVVYPNEETIVEMSSEKTSVEYENSEEHSPGLHLSVERGPLIEIEQIFKEEDYSSMGIAVTETIIEVSDVRLVTNNTSVEILERSEHNEEDARVGEDQSFVTLDEASNGQLDQILDKAKEPDISLDSGGSAEDSIEVLYGSNSEVADELLSNMDPSTEVKEFPMNVEVSDQGMEYVGQSDDPTIVDIISETLEHKVNLKENFPEICYSSELGSIKDLEHSFEEHRYSSIIVAESQVEVAELNNDLTETENVLSKEIDPSSEIYNDLITHHTVEKTSESKEEEKEESQSSKTTYDTCRKQFVNLEVHEPVIHTETGSVAEYIDIILQSTSQHSQDEINLLSDLHSVKTIDHPIDVISVVSSTGKENILDPCKALDAVVESTVPVDVIPDEQEKNLIPDHTVEKTSESKEEEKEESQLSETIDDTYRKQFVNLEVHEPVIHTETGSVAEYIDIILESTSEHSQDEINLLSDLHSVKTIDHPIDVISVVSSTGKEDILDLCKALDAVVESTVPVDVISDDENLIPDHTVEKTSESKEEEKEESQLSETIDDTFQNQFGTLDVHEPVIHREAGPVAEFIDMILESTSEPSQDESVLLSDLRSVKMTYHTTDVVSVVSDTGEEHILDTSKACNILVESTVQVNITPDTVIPDEKERNQNDTSDICHPEELGSSSEPSQESEENQPNSSTQIFIEESHIGLGIVSTAQENVNVLLIDDEPKEMDLLSEIQSVITSTSTSTVKVAEVAGEDLFTKSITTEGNQDFEEANQKSSPSEPGKDLEKKLHVQESPQPILSMVSHHTEDITSVDINEYSKPADFDSSDLEIRLTPSIYHSKQEAVEGQTQLSSEEALRSDENKQVITISTDKPPKLIEPPTHMEINEDYEKPLGDHKEIMKKPSMEEDDDIDNSLFPHNTLDISAQKSRVQLRRKTSIRRKQGQRQDPSESEPVEPPQPMPRPRPMGVPIFPGKIPIFPMVPARTPAAPHPTEEQKEERPAEAEESLIKPKKVIPKHAGFGFPHPQMMHELQSRLKKKKPNE